MRVLALLICALPSLAAAQEQASDQQFLDKAYSINKGEIELGKLAQKKGTSPAVREFGMHLQQDHQKALDQLRDVAHRSHLMMPTSIQREESDLYTQLSKLDGKQFDEQFTQHMVDGHKEAIRLFETQASMGQNPDLKKFAQDQIPVLKQHEAMAKRDLSRM